MKLQLFQEYHSTAYYTEITAVAYNAEDDRQVQARIYERFTPREIQLVRDYVDLLYVPSSRLYVNHSGNYELNIFKDEREYYYVKYKPAGVLGDSSFYRCDQLAGLAEWLTHYTTPRRPPLVEATQTTAAAYYQVLTAEQYLDYEDHIFTAGQAVPFSNLELTTIYAYFGPRYYWRLSPTKTYLDLGATDWFINIFKGVDEFYYLCYRYNWTPSDRFYRCDQFAGVVQWLEDFKHNRLG